MTSVIVGKLGLPGDAVAMGALGLAIALWVIRHPTSRYLSQLDERRATAVIRSLVLIGALGSLVYFYVYLRGGPRIIDATYYWLQAKAFASGHLTIPLLHPSAALRGRFLYFDPSSHRLSVLFPPGYAAILALGMRMKAPQFVGPCMAGALVWVTAALARRVFADSRAAVSAAVLSVVCVALRYHTADTMSHGLAALLFTTALFGAAGSTRVDFAIAGLCVGWLAATRPVSALALTVIVTLTVRSKLARSWLPIFLGTLPGIALWLVYQRVTTGHWLHSTQFAYYAVSDGPPGCFRYGFGTGIGCRFEHGEFVSRRMPHGYDWVAALTVIGVRLRWHLLDILNFEPLALLLLVAGKDAWHRPSARPLLLAPFALLIAYAPFYFDGNYPGGGARMLSEVLPVEHVLLAGWVSGLTASGNVREQRRHGRLVNTVALALLGFSLHGSFEHRQLQNREGGRPMFEANVLARAGVHHGLILVGTDHGFALGHEPGKTDAQHGIVVAREHGDAHDRLLWKSLGSPPVYRYNFPFTREQANPKLQPLAFAESKVWRFETEAEWPVLSVHQAWAVPGYPPTGCVSNQRALLLHPEGNAPSIDVAVPVPEAGRYRTRVGWVSYEDEPMTVRVRFGQAEWNIRTTQSRFECGATDGPLMELNQGEHPIRLKFEKTIALDWIELVSAD